MDIMKQDNKASFGEFMKISVDGFSWAENICQRVENICTENNIVQNPGKYVNEVGEHFKKTSGKMGDGLDGDHVHENPSDCICGEAAAFMETLSVEHDSVPNVLENLGSGCKKNSSDGTVFTTTKLDESFSSTVNSLSEHGDGTLAHEGLRVEIEESVPLEKYACVRFEREVHSAEDLSQIKLPTELQFLNKKDSTEANSSMTHTRIATENLNICSSEEFVNSSIFSLKNEDLNEFEDVKLEDDFEAVKAEDDWDDMIKAEIALISSLAAKKESSKNKLKKILTSRWRPSRGRQLVTYQADMHSKSSLDSDWELL